MSQFEDGVYFNMPDDVYHSLPFLSSTGIKNLLIHPTVYWANSHMNTARDREDTIAQIAGRAYHTRILEGKEKFQRDFVSKFEAPSGCLDTVDDLKEALSKASLPTTGKKPELIKRVQENLPTYKILDAEKVAYAELHEGKQQLDAEFIAKVEVAAAMIEKHPEISKCFRGGYPEVTVIWTELQQLEVPAGSGQYIDMPIRFKSRFDYLKPRAITDLKSFANMMNKPVEAAIYGAMASYKYHIQAAFYLKAVAEAQKLIRHGKMFEPVKVTAIADGEEDRNLYGWGTVVVGVDMKPWLDAFLDCDEHGFYFVFQQKGNAPIAKCKKFPRRLMYGAGVTAIEQAIETYKSYLHYFGDEMWLDMSPIDDFEDERFPLYATEI